MSVRRKPSLNILLPKSPKRYLSPLATTKRANYNIIQLDSCKNSRFSKIHRSSSNIQTIVENFLSSRYSEPQFTSSPESFETNMIVRIKQVLNVNNKGLRISEYLFAQKEKIRKVLSIVEEETLKSDEKLECLKIENRKLKMDLAEVNAEEVQNKRISIDEVLEVCKAKTREPTGDLVNKINLIKNFGNKRLVENLEGDLEKIIIGDEKRLAGALCKEILNYKFRLPEKSEELRTIREKRVELESKIRNFDVSQDEVGGEIDLFELAETWTDVSCSDESGKKGYLIEN